MKKTCFRLAVMACIFFAVAVSAKKQVVIDVMAHGEYSDYAGESWIRIVNEFEKLNPDIKINYELLHDQQYHNKVMVRLVTGKVPDLAYMGADAVWGGAWKEADQQFDHRPYLDKKLYDMNLIPPMGPNGEIYVVPLGVSNICSVLYMNTDFVKKLGFKEPATYDDIVKMVPKAKLMGIKVVSIDGADEWSWGTCLISSIVARMTGDLNWVQKAISGEKKFTDVEFISALSMLEKMVEDGVIGADSLSVDYGTNISDFSDGKALFMVQGQWAAASVENEKLRNKMRLMAWPAFPGQKDPSDRSVAAALSVGYGLTKKGGENREVREAGLRFLNYFYSSKEATLRMKNDWIVAPLNKDYKIPKDLYNYHKEKIGLSRNSKSCDVIDAYLTGESNDYLNMGLMGIVSGRMSPAEVAVKLEKIVRKDR